MFIYKRLNELQRIKCPVLSFYEHKQWRKIPGIVHVLSDQGSIFMYIIMQLYVFSLVPRYGVEMDIDC